MQLVHSIRVINKSQITLILTRPIKTFFRKPFIQVRMKLILVIFCFYISMYKYLLHDSVFVEISCKEEKKKKKELWFLYIVKYIREKLWT